jgi:hypothetical protein
METAERKELKPEEKLQKVINQIIKERSNYISVDKLMDILGIEPILRDNITKSLMTDSGNKEFKESYIS